MTPRVAELEPHEAHRAAARGRALLVDVRETREWARMSVPGARSLPLEELPLVLTALERAGVPVVFLCRDGARSRAAAQLLARRGKLVTGVVGGGLDAWRRAGLPTISHDFGG